MAGEQVAGRTRHEYPPTRGECSLGMVTDETKQPAGVAPDEPGKALGEPGKALGEPGKAPDEPVEEPDETPKAVPLLALDSRALVTWFTEVLASRAWVDMGLLADPLTGQVAKNLDSARLAIDAFEGLAKVLKGARPEESRRLEGILTDLRLNFVRQAGSE